MPQSNIDPLDGAHEWCAVESINPAIAWEYFLKDMEDKLDKFIEEQLDQETTDDAPGCFYGLAGAGCGEEQDAH